MSGMRANLEIAALHSIGEGGFCWVASIFAALRLSPLTRVVISI